MNLLNLRGADRVAEATSGAYNRLILCIGLAFTLLVLARPVSALNHNPTAIRSVSQAYGFVMGQEYTLVRIAKLFPDLSIEVELVRAQFRTTFPEIFSKLEAELTAAIGAEKVRDLRAEFEGRLREVLGSRPLTREGAVAFLEQVRARARGEIEPLVLGYLLATKYTSSPVSEFADGFRQRFNTADHAKARGIRLGMQLPRSWAAAEGERPHIVQKWTSENGTGLETILLDIRDAEGYEPDRTEIARFLRSGEIRQAIPPSATYIESGTVTVEQRAGYWIHMKLTEARAGTQLHQAVVMYQFFFRGSAVGVMCLVGRPPAAIATIDEALNRIRPLCQQILNSIVLEQLY